MFAPAAVRWSQPTVTTRMARESAYAVWSADGTLLQTLTPELGVIEDARFSADGARLAIADHDTVLVWDTGPGDRSLLDELKESERGVFLGRVLD